MKTALRKVRTKRVGTRGDNAGAVAEESAAPVRLVEGPDADAGADRGDLTDMLEFFAGDRLEDGTPAVVDE